MNRAGLPYWVFTSGEDGVNGLDWGIKHASSAFANRYELDRDYRSQLRSFSLPPSLERPKSGVGLLLLPWRDGALLGFLFPGFDLKGRPNTSAIVCVVASDIVRTTPVSDVIGGLWSANALEEIAQRNAVRPDMLQISAETPSSVTRAVPPLPAALKWPREDVGYLMIDGNIRKLQCLYPAAKPSASAKSHPLPRYAALLLFLALSWGIFACWGSIREFFGPQIMNLINSLLGIDNASSSGSSSQTQEVEEEDDKEVGLMLKKIKGILNVKDASRGLEGIVWVSSGNKRQCDEGDVSSLSGSSVGEKSETLETTLNNGDGCLFERIYEEDKCLVDEKALKDRFGNIFTNRKKKLSPPVVKKNHFALDVESEEVWDKIKKELREVLTAPLSLDIAARSNLSNLCKDEEDLKNKTKQIFKQAKRTKGEEGHGYLFFFYDSREEGVFQALAFDRDSWRPDSSSERLEPGRYLLAQKSHVIILDLKKRLALEKRLLGDEESPKRPYVRFYPDLKYAAFFLEDAKGLDGSSFEKCLDTFLEELLRSVKVGGR